MHIVFESAEGEQRISVSEADTLVQRSKALRQAFPMRRAAPLHTDGPPIVALPGVGGQELLQLAAYAQLVATPGVPSLPEKSPLCPGKDAGNHRHLADVLGSARADFLRLDVLVATAGVASRQASWAQLVALFKAAAAIGFAELEAVCAACVAVTLVAAVGRSAKAAALSAALSTVTPPRLSALLCVEWLAEAAAIEAASCGGVVVSSSGSSSAVAELLSCSFDALMDHVTRCDALWCGCDPTTEAPTATDAAAPTAGASSLVSHPQWVMHLRDDAKRKALLERRDVIVRHTDAWSAQLVGLGSAAAAQRLARLSAAAAPLHRMALRECCIPAAPHFGFEQLQQLTVVACDGAVDAVLAAAAELPALRQLNLNDCPRITDTAAAAAFSVMRTRRLTQLSLDGCSAIGDAAVVALMRWQHRISSSSSSPSSAQLLRQLSLAFCDVSDAALRMLGSRPDCVAGMQQLSLRGCARITDVGVCALGALEGLTQLSLAGCASVTGAERAFGSLPRALKQLDLGFTALLDDASLAALAVQLPQLKQLTLQHCVRVTDQGVAALAAASPDQLVALDLSACPAITADAVAAVATQHQQSLRELRLAGCPRIDDSVGAQVAHTPFLTHLDLRRCPLVTRAGVSRIEASVPNCYIFHP